MGTGLRFGTFEVDLQTRELHKRGVRVRVPDQSFAILAMLIERPGELITREEIQQRLWPHGTIVEYEHGINSAVKRLREALGEPAGKPRYVETLPRRGYRFIASVESAPEPEPASHYRILGEAGRGAMGIVYRAEDKRLGRLVALKFLPEEMTGDAEALERLHSEARIAASLNHPGVCTLYGIDEHEGRVCLVMEYLEGQSLRCVIDASPLSVEQVFDIALQSLAALAAAHAHGIIHRDIKPGNLFVTGSCRVKLMDFGIAQRTGDSGALCAGTHGYASPEQSRGEELDGRSDIYSFGAVLREMTAACRGPVPAGLHNVIERCLQQERERRFQTADELKAALAGIAAPPSKPPPHQSLLRRWALAAVPLLIAAIALLWWRRPAPAPPEFVSLVQVTRGSGLSTDPALSPDGKWIVYASDRDGYDNLDLWIDRLGNSEPMRLTNDPADEAEPVFSPDGTRIAFRSEAAGGGIYVMSVPAGTPQRIAPGGRNPQFSPDGKWIAYWMGAGVSPLWARAYVVPSNGGTAKPIFSELTWAGVPAWSAGGQWITAVSGIGSAGRIDVYAAPFDSAAGTSGKPYPLDLGKGRSLLATFVPTSARWMPGNRALVVSDLSGMAANILQFEISGNPPHASGAPRRLTSGTTLDIPYSPVGRTIPFASETHTWEIWELPLDANLGKTTGPPKCIVTGAISDVPSLSADGSRLLYASNRHGPERGAPGPGGRWELLLRDLASGREMPLKATVPGYGLPALSPDGRIIVYGTREGIVAYATTSLDQMGPPQLLYTGARQPLSFTREGRKLLYRLSGSAVSLFAFDTGTSVAVLEHAKPYIMTVKPSPDNAWLAIQQIDAAGSRIYIAPFRDTPVHQTDLFPVTAEDGLDYKPRWSPDGNLLYFVSDRDGFRCIWSQRLHPLTKRPSGQPVALYHSHNTRSSMHNVNVKYLEIDVAGGRLVFVNGVRTGNVWLAQIAGGFPGLL